jgi:hypothetical protein
MKTSILIAFLSIFLFSCSKDRITASGNKISETRNPGNFDGVFSSGSSNVHITYGDEHKVVIIGSDNLIPYYKTKIVSGHLYLGYERVNIKHDDIEVFVTLPAIRRISLSGSGSMQVGGQFPAQNSLRVSISGSGDVLATDQIEYDETDIDISGSGQASLENIRTEEAEIDISGSGDAKITVYDQLKARISGSGKIYYKGNPIVDSQISGSGKVIKL